MPKKLHNYQLYRDQFSKNRKKGRPSEADLRKRERELENAREQCHGKCTYHVYCFGRCAQIVDHDPNERCICEQCIKEQSKDEETDKYCN
jgi:hypothetical protein